jgi:hypothetical protein
MTKRLSRPIGRMPPSKPTAEDATQRNASQHNVESVPEEHTFGANQIQIRINPELKITVSNWINSAHAEGDYTYASSADLYRAALLIIGNEQRLTGKVIKGRRVMFGLRVDNRMLSLWKELPQRARHDIFERAVKTILIRSND